MTTPSSLIPHPYRILVASRSFGKATPDVFDRLKAAGAEVIPNPLEQAPTEADMVTLIKDVDVLISGTEPVTKRVFAAANKLKGIAKHGVGYENIDLVTAKARNIPVAVAGGTITNSVADMAMGLLLALARKIPAGDRAVRAGRWPRAVGVELAGKTLGIVGLGQIGKALCKRAKGFEMNVIAYDTYRDDAFAAQWGVQYVELETLIKTADFISLHAPGGKGTRRMMSSERLALMKPTAYLINTARGELVDEGALYVALKRNQLAGAALDVFEEEPPGLNPLFELDNFVAAPHSAGQTKEGLRAMGEITCDNVIKMLKGEEPMFKVS
jgi:D-3-phosphoglycerate dehydrogenase